MAAYGIYGAYPPATDPNKPKATDVFSSAAPAGATATAQGAQPNQASSVTGAPAPSPFALPGAQKAPASPFAPIAPAANPGGFESLLNNAGPARQQNANGAQQAISDMLMAPTGPSRESEAARSAFIKAQNEAGRQSAEQSALAGRVQTGQIRQDNRNFQGDALSQRRDLENDLAISDGKRNDQNRQAGVSAFLQQESLSEQSRASQAGLAQQDRALAENARQFNTQQEFQEWATKEGYKQDEIARAWQSGESEKARASTEKVAFAGLSLEERKLAQEGSQFATKIDFDKWALGKNLDNETATRLWQSIENEKSRTSTEKVAFAGLNLEERQLAQQGSQFDRKQDFDKWALTQQMDDAKADRIWQSIEAEKARTFTGSENALDRTLNSSQFAERLGLDRAQLGETIRQFNSREDFDRWAKNLDVSQEEKAQVWKAQQDDITRKWTTGERLSSQEHEVLLEKMSEDAEINKMERNQVLNLDTLEKQQAHDEKILGLQSGYQSLRDQQGFSHEAAMAEMQGQIQANLSAQGYSQEQALQGARLEVQRIEGERNREMEERLSLANLASSSNIALQELGIKRESLDLTRQQVQSELEAAGFNLQDAKLGQALATASVLLEKWGDNPDTQAKAAEIMYAGLRDGGQITEEQYKIGILNSKASGFKDPAAFKAWAASNGYDPATVDKVAAATTNWGTDPGATPAANGGTAGAVQTAQDRVDEIAESLPAGTQPKAIQDLLQATAARTTTSRSSIPNSTAILLKSLPGYSANVVGGSLLNHTNASASPEAMDFLGFVNMVKMGVSEKEAGSLLSTALGPERFGKAYKALTGKDWVNG